MSTSQALAAKRAAEAADELASINEFAGSTVAADMVKVAKRATKATEVRPATRAEKSAAKKPAASTRKAAEFDRLVESSAKKVAKAAKANGADKPVASTDPVIRYQLSKLEHDAVKRWDAAGRKGAKPPTPNLDAMKADHEAGVKPKAAKANGRKRAEGTGTTAAGLSRVSDDVIKDWMKKWLTANPTASRLQARKAFRAAGYGASRSRFWGAFAEYGGQVGGVRTPKAKPEPAKKAPAKEAATKAPVKAAAKPAAKKAPAKAATKPVRKAPVKAAAK